MSGFHMMGHSQCIVPSVAPELVWSFGVWLPPKRNLGRLLSNQRLVQSGLWYPCLEHLRARRLSGIQERSSEATELLVLGCMASGLHDLRGFIFVASVASSSWLRGLSLHDFGVQCLCGLYSRGLESSSRWCGRP